MAVKLEHIRGMQFKAYTEGDENSFVMLDSAKEAGGSGDGMKPTDLLLASIAGCSSMDIISILRKKKQEISSYNVIVEGIRAEEHPKVFTKIILTYEVKGKNIEEGAVKRAIDLSRGKYCSVWAMLCKAAEIEYSYRIIND